MWVTKSTAVVNLVPTLWLDGTASFREALIAPLFHSIPLHSPYATAFLSHEKAIGPGSSRGEGTVGHH